VDDFAAASRGGQILRRRRNRGDDNNNEEGNFHEEALLLGREGHLLLARRSIAARMTSGEERLRSAPIEEERERAVARARVHPALTK